VVHSPHAGCGSSAGRHADPGGWRPELAMNLRSIDQKKVNEESVKQPLDADAFRSCLSPMVRAVYVAVR
jgi:hypothetical protein